MNNCQPPVFDPVAYAQLAAAAIDLPLPEHCMPGVAANLARLHVMASLLMSFPLPDDETRDPP